MFKVSTNIVCRFVEDEAIIMKIDTNALFSVNEVGADILKIIKNNENVNIDDIYLQLNSIYEVNDTQLKDDIESFLKLAQENNVIEVIV